MKILLLIIMSLMFVPRVNAHYVDLTQINLNNKKEVTILNLNEYATIHHISEDNEGNILMMGTYQEKNNPFANNGNVIPGNDGGGVNGATGGTSVRSHTKIIKLDSNYNELWETNVLQVGNWSNPDPTASTVALTLNSITQLTDGTYVAVGQTFGLKRENDSYQYALQGNDDDFDAFIIRLDQNGNEIHRESIRSKQVDNMLEVKALNNGGYAIKVYGWPQGYQNIEKTNLHYFIYNANNELIDTFSNADYLDNFGFVNSDDIYDIKYSVGGEVGLYRHQAEKFYLGITINNELMMTDKNYNNITFYNPETMTELRKIDISEYKLEPIEKIIMTNTGGFIVEGKVFDSSGKLLYTTDNNYKLALSNGNLVYVDRDNKIYSTEIDNNANEDFAKFIINGIEIKQNLGVFTENNRTYISLNNLCGIMDCKHKRSEKNNNKLIIDFNILDRGNNKMINDTDASIEYKSDGGAVSKMNQALKVNYTVVHEIGSKSYETYLSIQPMAIYRLNSPYYTDDSVDVTSIEKDGQIYVPLRFISEALGRYVEYIPDEKGGKPTIKIGAYGEGEFFEKYGVAMSYSNFKEGDTLTDIISENKITLPWGMEKLAYGYGYNKLDNKIVNASKTVYVPVRSGRGEAGIDESQAIPYNGEDYNIRTNHFYISSFETKDNWIGKNEMYMDNNGEEGEKVLENSNYLTFVLVSNIEGYPFMKFVHFK